MKKEIMDGNKACANVAYNFTEVAGIYPITPSSAMAEYTDEWSSFRLNIFNSKAKVVEMQSEAGAIGMVHGLLQAGVLATTYTSSQGLLLMIPNMYKIAGELLPCVINVASRTVATHALSIMGDHSDIYLARSTGFAILSSSSVQQVMDLTGISYLSAIKGRVPFINTFDGFRTSHEFNKIEVIDDSIYKDLIDYESLNNFRLNSLDIDNPTTRGTNQSDQIYFQAVEARNKYYDNLPDIVESYMQEISKLTNRTYHPFNYYGSKNAKKVIVAMGSVCETIKEVCDNLDEEVGLIEVHLFRPFSDKYFLNVLPKTTKKIAVLDRAKEAGANGEALYLDVCELIKRHNLDISVVGGRYGLSGKNTDPNDIHAVYNYLDNDNLTKFTLGIDDDITNISLEKTNKIFQTNAKELLIYGFGSDGMVTTSKDILKIIGNKENRYVQGYFEYDSKKSGGVTRCHLRFSDNPIKSTYYVKYPSMIVVSKDTYLKKYNLLKDIKEEGIFLLNTESTNNLENILTLEDIKIIKDKRLKFYVINASKIASDNNIKGKISIIMEKVILYLLDVLDNKEVEEEIEKMIRLNFAKKGKDIINANINSLNEALNSLILVDIDKLISNIEKEKVTNTIFSKLEHYEGEKIKVSDFNLREEGIFEPGLSKLEKRGLSNITPCYDKEKCIMCNMCSFVCPHAVVRPYLLDKEEVINAPKEVLEDLLDAKIKDQDLKFTIGISSLDCTGCSLCSNICPTKAITMRNINESLDKETVKFNYLDNNVTYKNVLNINTVKGSQFVKPKFEFHGACAGCGETPYLKLLTQLFGDNLMIANATGCSSIYGASLPNTPYSIPWVNSLFEDNAEFGMGIRVAEDYMRNKVRTIMKDNLESLNDKNKTLVDEYLNNYSKDVSFKVFDELDYDDFKDILPYKKYIKEKSIWLVGGDGWAYDIGFGGIDHVLASYENVNILVLDTEVYSNTGGQASKSTRVGAVAKFAANGKELPKKDLAKIALTYPHVYVATVSLGANYNQVIKAFTEANNYDGPSIIIAYAPCIAHGIKEGMSSSLKEEKLVVDSGYFPLFRYNPKTCEFNIDSKSDFSKYEEIFSKENRYASLKEDRKHNLFTKNKDNALKRYDNYQKMNKK